MRILVLIVALLLAFPANSQEQEKKNIFKEFYNDFFKYATVYAAGDYRAPYESSNKKYLIRQPKELVYMMFLLLKTLQNISLQIIE